MANREEVAAPAVDSETLMALENARWEELATGDLAAMRAHMAEDIVLVGPEGFMRGADEWLTMMFGYDCDRASWSTGPMRVSVLSPTSVFLTYRGQQTTTCGGESMPESEHVNTSIWVLQDGNRKLAYLSSPRT